MAEVITHGTGGDTYIPYNERTGGESVVYFTRDLSEEGLRKIYERVNSNITGKVAIKLHTGEKMVLTLFLVLGLKALSKMICLMQLS